jgi:uncharacterized protein CbrC (UPF0167 family)
VTIESFPDFRYHPDPLGTGSVITSGQSCDVCGQARGYVYDGPVYAEDDQWACCPWCIADGSAARKLDAGFTEAPDWNGQVAEAATDEVLHRTPGFTAWRRERWLSHHGDAAAFLGVCGIQDLRKHGDAALAAVRLEAAGQLGEDADLEAYVESLDVAGSPTAYLFRCLHCDEYLAYSDSHED